MPSSVEEALRVQEALAPSVVRTPPPGFAPRTAQCSLTPKYRLPETTRQANYLSRQTLRGH